MAVTSRATAGARIGEGRHRFVIDGCLGRGAFGEVYRAEMTTEAGIATTVALKVLHPHLGRSAHAVARLRDEAATLARLNHPTILRVRDLVVLDSVPGDGRLALVTEYVDGDDLERCLFGRDPIGPRAVCDVLARIARALAAADALPGPTGAPLRLVHRDVKPSNVRLGRNGEVKLLDFGLARTDDPDRLAHTRTDTILGSPPYMAPERFLDNEPRSASDVFALGVIAAEARLGKRLFDVPVTMLASYAVDRARFEAHVANAVRPAPNEGAAVAAYIALVGDLLAYDPARRPDATEAAERFEACADALPGPTFARFCRTRLWTRIEPDRAGGLVGTVIVSGAPRADAAEPGADGDAATAVRVAGPRDTFVGRGNELAEVAALFDGGARVVSVVGPGGVGKTRLALRFAGDQPAGTAWFADLAEARDVEGVVVAVAAALKVRIGRDAGPARLGHALAGRGACLVVLDNFEQVVPYAAETVGVWLELAPDARFLVTTRERLRVPDEGTVELAPLPPADAEALFVRRARAALPSFTVAPDDDVPALVALLDHLPLAIELAAARVTTLSPRTQRERMGDRFRLLASRTAPAGERHGTLRATLDWSWDLLGDEDRRTLAQLSVFEGGFDVAAAEAVVALGPGGGWVVDSVQSLVDKSLVRRSASVADRFELLLGVRAYAAERLDATVDRGWGDRAAAEARHAAHYAGYGAQDVFDSYDADAGRFTRAVPDLGNLRLASRTAAARGDGRTAGLAALAAWRLIEPTGAVGDALALLERAAALSDAERDPDLAGRVAVFHASALLVAGRMADAERVLHAALGVPAIARIDTLALRLRSTLGRCLGQRGQLAEGCAVLEQVLAGYRALGERRHAAHTLHALGSLTLYRGDPVRSREMHEAALALARETVHPTLEADVLTSLGNVAVQLGDTALARSRYEEAIALFRAAGTAQQLPYVVYNLGSLAMDEGRFDDARGCFEQALAGGIAAGDQRFTAAARAALGGALHELGDTEAAREQVERALAITRVLGDRRLEGGTLGNLAELDLADGRLASAAERFDAAIAVHREVGNRRTLGTHLAARARVAARLGDPLGALAMLDEAVDTLRGVDARELGIALCRRAEVAAEVGDLEAAASDVTEAEGLADAAGLGPSSMLGRALADARRVVGLAPR